MTPDKDLTPEELAKLKRSVQLGTGFLGMPQLVHTKRLIAMVERLQAENDQFLKAGQAYRDRISDLRLQLAEKDAEIERLRQENRVLVFLAKPTADIFNDQITIIGTQEPNP